MNNYLLAQNTISVVIMFYFVALMVLINSASASKYKEFEFHYKHYPEQAYDTAISKLVENEYIIKKTGEYDSGNKNNYCVTYITNMGNIIYIGATGKNIKFGYSSKLGQNMTTENTTLHDKIIDKIVEHEFCKNGDTHYSKIQKELNEFIIFVQSLIS